MREIIGMNLGFFYLSFSPDRRSKFMLGMPQTCAAYQFASFAVKTNKIELLLRKDSSHHDDETFAGYDHRGSTVREHEPEGPKRDLPHEGF